MSFGGSVSAMITTLKNNSRAKRKTYFDRENSISNVSKQEKNKLLEKKTSPELLAEIKREMIKENRQARIKTIFITLLSILTLILIIIFIKILFTVS